jgi:predicted nuclease of predicted toxin-antitoxin system
MIRFLIDAQLPPGLVHRLSVRGFEAEHVNRIGLGLVSDLDIWRHAGRTGACLITKDEDFVALAGKDGRPESRLDPDRQYQQCRIVAGDRPAA